MCGYLKSFKTVSTFSGQTYSTFAMVITSINIQLDKFEKWAYELDNENQRDETDEKLIISIQAAKDK